MTDELKPCPFCGSPARLLGGPMAQETYSVWCSGPARHSMDYGFNREVAVESWNTRAYAAPRVKPLDVPRVVALVEALRAAADALDDYSPLTGNAIETPASRSARAALSALEGQP